VSAGSEAKRLADAEATRKKADEERIRQEAEAKRLADAAAAKKKAEDERARQEAEAKRLADAATAKKKATTSAPGRKPRPNASPTRQLPEKADDERARQEAEAKRLADAAAAKKKADEEAQAADAARRLAEAEDPNPRTPSGLRQSRSTPKKRATFVKKIQEVLKTKQVLRGAPSMAAATRPRRASTATSRPPRRRARRSLKRIELAKATAATSTSG